MFMCPECEVPLKKKIDSLGLFWVCPVCNGRAVTLEILRKSMPRPIVNELWQRARSGEFKAQRNCPGCRRKMSEIPIVNEVKMLYLDVCAGCHFVWFDPNEFESLPKLEIIRADLPETMKERETLALARLEALKNRQEPDKMFYESPDHWWEYIPAFFWMPVEYDSPSLVHKPIVTWSLAAIIVIVFAMTYNNLEAAVKNYGLIPAELFRHFGFTFISSFFLHGGFIHLLGNLYFLIIFGDNSEDVLGKFKYLLLIALAALAGDFVHIIGDPRSNDPLIGASGGIFGILVYYCLRFPTAKIGILVLFRWFIRIPVGYMLAFWVAEQLVGAFWQRAGVSNVSSLAHLGGAAVGIIFWLIDRKSFSQAAVT